MAGYKRGKRSFHGPVGRQRVLENVAAPIFTFALMQWTTASGIVTLRLNGPGIATLLCASGATQDMARRELRKKIMGTMPPNVQGPYLVHWRRAAVMAAETAVPCCITDPSVVVETPPRPPVFQTVLLGGLGSKRIVIYEGDKPLAIKAAETLIARAGVDSLSIECKEQGEAMVWGVARAGHFSAQVCVQRVQEQEGVAR